MSPVRGRGHDVRKEQKEIYADKVEQITKCQFKTQVIATCL